VTEPRGILPEPDYLIALRRRLDALTRAEPMAAEAVRLAASLRRVTEPPRSQGYEHGLNGYRNHGCRCPECCEAQADAQTEYRKRPGVKEKNAKRERDRAAKQRAAS
jgi:hypothetical protein